MATPAVTVAAMMNRGEVTIRRKGTDAVNALVPFFCFSFLKTRYARISDQRSSVEKEQKVICSFLSCKRKGTKECTTPKAP